MPEFDDHPIPGDNDVGDCSEAGFIVVRARGCPSFGVIYDGHAGEGIGEVDTPAW
jgi:hypothetical protein